MKTQPVVPASIAFGAHSVTGDDAQGRRWRPPGDALARARQVFLARSGLPGRWRGRDRFTMLETGFGRGDNFLAAWDAWRGDPARSRRLDFIAIEKHPFECDALARLHTGSPLAALTGQLVDAWPPLVPSLHALHFDDRRVRLLLAFGDVDDWLPEIVARVDAFFLDGFAPGLPAAASRSRVFKVFKTLARLCAPGATVATRSDSQRVRDGLAAAGFDVRAAPGINGESDITVATFAPRFVPKQAPARIGLASDGTAACGAGRRALIVGGGLAGSACAWALAEHGWASRLVDRLPGPAQATSGNAAGLFHSVLHAQEGAHARFNRAAALHAVDAVHQALAHGDAAGQQAGVLRVAADKTLAEMRRVLDSLGLPSGYAQVLTPDEARERSGLPLDVPAWWHPAGGWVDPAGLVRSFLRRAGDAVHFDGGADVAALRRGAPGRWQLLGPDGRVIDEASVVILANGLDALRLAGPAAHEWPLRAVRGQTTLLPAATPGLRLPAIPVAGDGYVLPALPDGWALCGATSGPDDAGLDVRMADHRHNLARLARLTGSEIEAVSSVALRGRAGVRCVAADRLPLIGGVPSAGALGPTGGTTGARSAGSLAGMENDFRRLDQPRFVPRAPGLFVFTALASRGIAWSALGAQVLASVIGGAACPVEASLLDAVDAARFASRAARRG